jgi:hypothetical protein
MMNSTFATIMARFAGIWLLLAAVMQLPALFTVIMLAPTANPSFESRYPTNSPAYESMRRAQEGIRQTATYSRRVNFNLYFSFGSHIVAGLLFLIWSKEIGALVCSGADG